MEHAEWRPFMLNTPNSGSQLIGNLVLHTEILDLDWNGTRSYDTFET